MKRVELAIVILLNASFVLADGRPRVFSFGPPIHYPDRGRTLPAFTSCSTTKGSSRSLVFTNIGIHERRRRNVAWNCGPLDTFREGQFPVVRCFRTGYLGRSLRPVAYNGGHPPANPCCHVVFTEIISCDHSHVISPHMQDSKKLAITLSTGDWSLCTFGPLARRKGPPICGSVVKTVREAKWMEGGAIAYCPPSAGLNPLAAV